MGRAQNINVNKNVSLLCHFYVTLFIYLMLNNRQNGLNMVQKRGAKNGQKMGQKWVKNDPEMTPFITVYF